MYYRPRLIPCLSIQNRSLVKTVQFSNPRYLGDPINAVRIFNDKGVDELAVLDITASQDKRGPDFQYLQSIACEAFMPLSYGGGITSLSEIKKLFYIGFEKVIINTGFINTPELIMEAVSHAGSQSIVVSIDVKRNMFVKYYCYACSGKIKTSKDPVTLAKEAELSGAGEILLNSISDDGMMNGYDLKLVKMVSESVSIPVIACGGARDITDFKKVLTEGGAQAAAAGSFYVYYGEEKAVLITVPEEKSLYDAGIYKI